jgi:hypothetical protein
MPYEALVVHHIDKNILNYSEKNLVLISIEEHNMINHANIKLKNRKSGIEELNRVGILNPHISQLKEKQGSE